MEWNTPIIELSSLAGNHFFMKRDDLLPFSFGGNKVRIAYEFFDDMERKGCNCIIGYGNARSNLCRVLSNIAFQRNIPCYIISPSERDGTRIITSNYRLVTLCNPIIYECDKKSVAATIEAVFKECKEKGLKPYYIYGDIYGKGNEATPVAAYDKCYEEIKEQTEGIVSFDYIFIATGTGMTQAGLIAGKMKNDGSEQIIGISVARPSELAASIIETDLKLYLNCDSNIDLNSKICVVDKYRCVEYGSFDKDIEDVIQEIYTSEGVPLDPTYTGKAFSGMLKYLNENSIQGKNILFIHTGGTPLFLDYINHLHEMIEIESCIDEKELSAFLHLADDLFPIPLSKRVNIEEFVHKNLQYGNALVYKDKDKIVAALLFYANNQETKTGYITALVTLPRFEGKGIAKQLLLEMDKIAINEGMSKMQLDTDIDNGNAIAFYIKRGYRIVDIDTKIKMERDL